MRNLTVGICVSAILAGCGGGGETPSSPTGNTTAMPAAIVKDPLRIVAGTAYDAGDGGLNPRWVIVDFDKDGNKDIFLRYDPNSSFSTTTTGTSPVRFFMGKTNGGFEQSTSIFPQGLSVTSVNRIIADDFNNDGSIDIALAVGGQDPYINDVNATSGHSGGYTQILTYTPNGYKLSNIINSPLNFGHHLSSGDINGDFVNDLVITSMMYVDTFVVTGDQNSNYKVDKSRFPSNLTNGLYTKKVLETFANNTVKKYQVMRFTSSAILDVNNDTRQDVCLLAASGTKTSICYLNDGSGYFSSDRIMELPVGPYGEGYYYQDQSDLTKTYEVGSVYLDTLVVDINGDGKKDLISVVTQANSTPSEYVYYRGAALQILINTGNGFVDETKNRTNFNYVSDKNFTHYDTIEYADVNNDKCKDILLHRGQVNFNDNANPTRILINDCKGNFTEKDYPSSLPKGVLTVLGTGHYAVLINTKDNKTNTYTQRVDDVYYDWSLGKSLFP